MPEDRAKREQARAQRAQDRSEATSTRSGLLRSSAARADAAPGCASGASSSEVDIAGYPACTWIRRLELSLDDAAHVGGALGQILAPLEFLVSKKILCPTWQVRTGFLDNTGITDLPRESSSRHLETTQFNMGRAAAIWSFECESGYYYLTALLIN